MQHVGLSTPLPKNCCIAAKYLPLNLQSTCQTVGAVSQHLAWWRKCGLRVLYCKLGLPY